MSASIKNENRIAGPSSHPPQWVPQSPAVAPGPSTSTAAPPAVTEVANSPPMAPGIGGFNLDLPPAMSRPFEGDGAAKDMPGRSDLAQGFSRPSGRRKAAGGWFGELAFAGILSAVLILGGATLLAFLNAERKQAADMVGMVTPLLKGSSWTERPAHAPRLAIASQKAAMNEPLPLGDRKSTRLNSSHLGISYAV